MKIKITEPQQSVHGVASFYEVLVPTIGRSVRSTTIASVLQIPTTTPTTPIIPNRREMGEVP